MIAFALLLLAAAGQAKPPTAQTPPLPVSIDGLPIGAIPKQELPRAGCAAFLWSIGPSQAMIAMANPDPAQLRVSLDGAVVDVPRTAQQGAGGFGFSATTEYEAAGIKAVLDMTIATSADLKDGAAVSEGTLRIDRAGQDSFVLPVKGLIGCA